MPCIFIIFYAKTLDIYNFMLYNISNKEGVIMSYLETLYDKLTEDLNIEEIQKKLEEQGEVNSSENDLFSNKLDCMLENIACIIASEKYFIFIS